MTISESFSSTSNTISRRSGSWKKSNNGKKIIKRRKNYILYKENYNKLKEAYRNEFKEPVTSILEMETIHKDGLEDLRNKWKDARKNKRKLEKLLHFKRKNIKKRRKLSSKFKSRTSSSSASSLSTNTIESIGLSKNSDYSLDKINRKLDKMGHVLKFIEYMNNKLEEHDKEHWRGKKKYKEHWDWAKKKYEAAKAYARRKAAAARRRIAAAARRVAAAARRAAAAARRAAAYARRKAREAAARIKRAAQRAAAAAKRAALAAVRKAKAVALAIKRKAAALARAAAEKIKAAARKLAAAMRALGGKKSDPWWMKAIARFPGGMNIYRAVKKWSAKLTAPFTRVINKIKSSATSAWNKVKSMSNKIANFAKKLKDLPGTLFRKAWTSITNTFKRVGRFLSDSVKTVFKGMKKIAKSAFSWIKKAVVTVSKGIKKFASKGWTWIKSTAKKMFGFFKKVLIKIWNWFKKIMTRLFAFLKVLFGGKSLVAKIMTFLVKIALNLFAGPPGQIIARIKYLNGSLDKWWLLIPPLSIFPLSIVGTGMFMNGKIKKGVDNELPYDSGYMKTIALLGLSVPILETVFDTTWFFWLFSIYIFGCWFFVYSMRDQKKCKNVRGRKDGWKPAKFIKSSANSALMFLVLRDVMELIVAALGRLPYIGAIFKLLNALPLVNTIFSNMSSAILTYVLNNMLNNTPKTKYCNDYPMKKAKARAQQSIIALAIYFLAYSATFRIKMMIKSFL
jgi:hypothetical protein